MAMKFKILTRTNMRAAIPGKPLYEHGIKFERSPTGDGVFSVNICVDNERIHRVIGKESAGTTRTQAEDFIGSARSDAKHDRLSLPKGRKVAMLFKDAADKYLSNLEESDGKDLKMKSSRLKLHLTPFFGSIPLSKITSLHVEKYKHFRQGEHSMRGGDRVSKKVQSVCSKPVKTSPGTVNRELAVLSHLINKAIEWNWISSRPPVMGRLKEGEGRIKYLTVDQAKLLISCAKKSDSAYVYPFILIGIETSMRMSEILSIEKANIDFEKRTIYIPKAKGGKREQPITQHLADFLKGYVLVSSPLVEWLFPSPASKTGHAVDIRKPFKKAVREAGLDPAEIVRHTLRHTAITHLVQAGVDLPTVKRISGHKTLAMIEKYAHQNGAHIAEAMTTLQNRMGLE